MTGVEGKDLTLRPRCRQPAQRPAHTTRAEHETREVVMLTARPGP